VATRLASLRPNSQGVRRSALKRLRKALGPRRITQIGRADVRRFVNDLSAERKANTVLAYYSTLRAVFTFAADDLDIPVTFPKLKPSELPDPVDDAREHRVLTDDELNRVLAAFDPPLRLYFQTLAETGCRASEALG
jgi:integrase